MAFPQQPVHWNYNSSRLSGYFTQRRDAALLGGGRPPPIYSKFFLDYAPPLNVLYFRNYTTGCPMTFGIKRFRVGDRFDRLEVIDGIPKKIRESSGHTRFTWLCRCDCGKEDYYRGDTLGKRRRSCGCLMRETRVSNVVNAERHKKYLVDIFGDKDLAATYWAWANMKQRCYNEKAINYQRYGGRGVTVCERWLGDYEMFLSDMGIRPDGLSLDRIDVGGNYEPGNCRWASREVQHNNLARTKYVVFDEAIGPEKFNLGCKKRGLDRGVIYGRLKNGWTIQDAMAIPINHHDKENPKTPLKLPKKIKLRDGNGFFLFGKVHSVTHGVGLASHSGVDMLDNKCIVAWRKRMKMTRVQACGALGIGENTLRNYERGWRSDTGDVQIPLYIGLACAAVEAGLGPVGRGIIASKGLI